MPQRALRTYMGAIHIHSDKSDGEGSLADIVSAARQSGVDFVVLTDHGTRGYGTEGKEGWHDGVLVLCGEEVSNDDGHLLAFEGRDDIGEQMDVESALAAVSAQHATSVSIHHQLPSLGPEATLIPPPVPMQRTNMVEVWSFMDEFLARVQPRYFLQACTRPDKLINGPSRSILRQWDRVLQTRRMAAFAGLNVHARKQPLMEWKTVFSYQVAFQSLVTCIRCQELPGVSLRARDLVWAALREGRSFMLNRSVGDEKNFDFHFQSADGRIRFMGDECTYDPRGRFYVSLSRDAEVVLRHNGQPLFWSTVKEASFPVAGPGSYRIEVLLNRRTWILTNAIRLVDDEGTMQPTVSDLT
ncbi:hypothetical protein GC173_01110 [bacterium]|nr:hypothetical protein [bacterium]